MSGFLVVASLLSVWLVVALVTGLVLGRMFRMRDRRQCKPRPRRAVDLITAGRTLAPRIGAHGN